MKFAYFTKMLSSLTLPQMAEFLENGNIDGADLAVRPGHPVTPANVASVLPEAVKVLGDRGRKILLVSAPTSAIDPSDREMQQVFHSCAENRIPSIKIGYFPYTGRLNDDLARAYRALEGFSRLAEKTGVKACYHTHSGANLGSNGSGLRLLLANTDPHHVGAYVDTGHLALNGEPLRMAFELASPWMTLIAIKDILWSEGPKGWTSEVVPAGTGIVRWKDFKPALADRRFDGTISLHGEYDCESMDERLAKAKEERSFFARLLGSS